MTPDENTLLEAVDAQQHQARSELEALIRIPSVGADPEHRADLDASAQAVAALARGAGAEPVRVLSVEGGAPAVVASWPAPTGMPTVLLYAHHDVQPAPTDNWHTDPFEPVEQDGRLYGRGSADDKGGVIAHLVGIRAHGGRPPVGVTLFVEGEEEMGSPTFATFLSEYSDLLAADVLVVADSVNWSVDVPALTTSLRGAANCTVEVSTLADRAHSGMGSAAPDALTALAHLLASLHHPDGTVAIDGLRSGARVGPDLDVQAWRAETGVLNGVDLLGSGPLTDRLWMQPSVAVLAIDAPRLEDSAMVLVPTARAEVSLRFAPGQEAESAMSALVAHLESHAPWGARVTVTPGLAAPSTAIDLPDDVGDLARRTLRDVFGSEAVEIGVGGSIPFLADLAVAYPDAAILVTGAGDPQANWHGPNENLHLGMFERNCRFVALLLHRLAATTG